MTFFSLPDSMTRSNSGTEIQLANLCRAILLKDRQPQLPGPVDGYSA